MPNKLAVTFFDDFQAGRKREQRLTLDQLAEAIRTTSAPAKAALPWLKLARFGNRATAKGSLRHDANVIAITGAEADYDGETVSFDDAVEIVEKSGLRAIIYTSPSHTPERPRWRILCPTSIELPPLERVGLLNRLNGLFRGIFATESWTLSQSYYFGCVDCNPAHQVEFVDGEPVDQLHDLDLIAIGKPNGAVANGASHGLTPLPLDEAAIEEAIRTGEAYHVAAVRLLGKWAQRGIPFLDAQSKLCALFDDVFPPDRDDRWEARRCDVPRLVMDIYGKEAGKRDDPDEAAKTQGSVLLNSGKGFALEKIEWLWPGWLAAGKLHLLAGAKATGKSTIAFDLSARLTTGGPWPDGAAARCGDVIVWSGEDGIEDTILPRFVCAGGALERVYPIKHVLDGGGRRPFDPATDIPALIEAAARLPDLRFVIIDPIVLVLPTGADSHKNTETRRGLQPLVEFAEQKRVALLGITHFTKGTADRDPIERVTGSLAFGALPRIVWGASADEDGLQRRLVRIASNIGPSGGGIEYTLHQEPLIEHDISAQRVAWGAKLVGAPRDLLDHKKQSAKADASGFLREILADGGMPQREVKAAAEAYGHAWATVRRAQGELGIKPVKNGKTWCWELPVNPEHLRPNWADR